MGRNSGKVRTINLAITREIESVYEKSVSSNLLDTSNGMEIALAVE